MMMRQYDNTKSKMEKGDKIKNYERELEKFRKEQSEKNVDNANNTETPAPQTNTETPAPQTEEDLKRMKSIEMLKQRDTVVYDESLSSEEKEALGEFVDKLNEIINDDDLLNLADSDEVRNDNNKRKLVNNEINARLKYNTLNNIPSGKLSRHNLAKLDYVSDEELKINLDIYKENYLETGNEEDYDRFKDIVNERVKRGTTDETEGNVLIKKTEEARVDLEKSGEKYTRKSNIPTLEEFDKNPEKYINKEEMTVSENLKKAEKLREEIEKTGGTYVFKDSQGNYVSNSPIVVLMSDDDHNNNEPRQTDHNNNKPRQTDHNNNETRKKDSEPRQKNKSDNSRNENSRNQNNETILPDLDEFDIPKETPNDVDLGQKEVDLGSNQENRDDNSDNNLNLPPLD